MSLHVAVLGATGVVGQEMMKLLESREWAIGAVTPIASARSRHQILPFRGEEIPCRTLEETIDQEFDLVLASAGATLSRKASLRFAERGAFVIDNSSAFRTDPTIPLVVPEINAQTLTQSSRIIANPNCSTIQMVMALAPLHRVWGLKAVRVATYQAVSGAGGRAVEELNQGLRAEVEGKAQTPGRVFHHPITLEALPHVGSFVDSETSEEIKMRDETRRLLEISDLPVSATCVRIPVRRGHSEAVWATFHKTPEPERARELMADFGLIIQDDPANADYPLARTSAGEPGVFVGRVRKDEADEHGLCMWIVSDNLLKGAALNAIQIADTIVSKGWVGA